MINKAEIKHSQVIGLIHHGALANNFLARLGKRFLVSLYSFLIKRELVIVYIE